MNVSKPLEEVSKLTRCSNVLDKPNQKRGVTPLRDNCSDAQLKAGCKIGGIKTARLTRGLETGTGETDFKSRKLFIKEARKERSSELTNPARFKEQK